MYDLKAKTIRADRLYGVGRLVRFIICVLSISSIARLAVARMRDVGERRSRNEVDERGNAGGPS